MLKLSVNDIHGDDKSCDWKRKRALSLHFILFVNKKHTKAPLLTSLPPAPCHEPQAPFTVTSPRVTIPFTWLQYMRMMLIFTARWRLHRGRNPCRLWSYALFKYSSFSNRPSNAKKYLKSRRIWTSNRPLQGTVKDILPLGGNSFTISY